MTPGPAVADPDTGVRPQAESGDAGFVRLAGVAGLLTVVVGALINLVLEGPGPAWNAPLAEVLAFTTGRADRLHVANGLRMAVVALLPVFAAGAYTWIGAAGGAWRLVGLLGFATVPALGIVANSGETIALWRLASLGQQPELVTVLWSMTAVLFSSALVLYAVGVAGFSLAGRAAGRLPAWLAVLGVVVAVVGIATGAGIHLVVTRTWAGGLAFSAFGLMALWLACMSILLVRPARNG